MRDQAEIYSEPLRSGRNLAESIKILPDLEGFGLDFVENGQKVVITRRKEKGFGLGRVSRVSKGKTDNQPAWGRVSEFGTRVRHSKSSDRVAVGWTQAGWPG